MRVPESQRQSATFVSINRWTLIAAAGLLAIIMIVVAAVLSTRGSAAAILGLSIPGVLASAAASVWSLATRPQLHLRPVPSHPKAFAVATAAHLVLFIGLSTWLWIDGSFELGAVLAPTLGMLYCALLVAFLPFVPYGALWCKLLVLAVLGCLALAGLPPLLVSVGLGGGALAYSAVYTVWYCRRLIDAEHSRALEAQLAGTEERLRIARDLHDTMGQHLAAITIKVQLAQALAEPGDARLHDELAELHRLTETAATDMRQVVEGYRVPDLESELAGAERVLTDAGARVRVTGAANAVPEALQETAAWFVREAATNILRHSRATEVTIAVTAESLSVTNDQPQRSGPPGRGLEGITQRAETDGATLRVDEAPDTFTVALEFAGSRVGK